MKSQILLKFASFFENLPTFHKFYSYFTPPKVYFSFLFISLKYDICSTNELCLPSFSKEKCTTKLVDVYSPESKLNISNVLPLMHSKSNVIYFSFWKPFVGISKIQWTATPSHQNFSPTKNCVQMDPAKIKTFPYQYSKLFCVKF